VPILDEGLAPAAYCLEELSDESMFFLFAVKERLKSIGDIVTDTQHA